MKNLKNIFKKNGSITFILCIVIVLILTSSSRLFWTVDNLNSLQTSIAPTAIVAFGMITVLICGVFDLSVGSIMLLCGILCSEMFTANLPVPLVIIAVLLVGASFGCINGLLVGVLKLNPLIVTIGTMGMAQGISLAIFAFSHKHQTVSRFPESFIKIGTNKFLGIYYMFWAMLLFLVLITFFQRYTSIGRQMYLTGDNIQVAKMMGINTTRIIVLAFTLTGILCAIAAILSIARYGQANRFLGEGINIFVIIACILGGASVAGGRGSAIGSLFGVVLMVLITNAFNLFEVSGGWQNTVIGTILITVVTIDGYLILRRKREIGKI